MKINLEIKVTKEQVFTVLAICVVVAGVSLFGGYRLAEIPPKEYISTTITEYITATYVLKDTVAWTFEPFTIMLIAISAIGGAIIAKSFR